MRIFAKKVAATVALASMAIVSVPAMAQTRPAQVSLNAPKAPVMARTSVGAREESLIGLPLFILLPALAAVVVTIAVVASDDDSPN